MAEEIKENVKYVFKKAYTTSSGTIPENSDIRVLRGNIYFNGGMVMPAYRKDLLEIINNPQLKNEYLREIKLVENVIA